MVGGLEGGVLGASVSKKIVFGGAESYRPALDACRAKLLSRLGELGLDKVVFVSDDNFSLSLTHKGASEEERELARGAVAETLAEFPMLRSIDGRLRIEIRAAVGWNRARMVEWITSVVCDDVVSQLGVHGAKPIYIGEEVAFSHISAIGGLDILVTGGPGADSFFLRSTTQVHDHDTTDSRERGRLTDPASMRE